MSERESVCGETTDHDQRIFYEDEDVIQWECRKCGAEWWEDKPHKQVSGTET